MSVFNDQAERHAILTTAKPTLKRIILVLSGLASALLLVEMGLRIQAHRNGIYRTTELPLSQEVRVGQWVWTASNDPELTYEHRPNYIKDGERQTDALGLVPLFNYRFSKQKGVYRVVLAGDSISAGFDVAAQVRFPVLLEKQLSARSMKTEIMNFGVNGYSVGQKVAMLRSKAIKHDPDLILLQYCLEDPVPAVVPYRWFKDREEPKSFMMNYVQTILDNRADKQEGPWVRLYNRDGRPWQDVSRSFQELGRLQSDLDVPVVVILFPLLIDEWPGYRYGAIHIQITDEARRHGLRVLDLLPFFAHYPLERVNLSKADPLHPGPFGHSIAASIIEKYILSEITGQRL